MAKREWTMSGRASRVRRAALALSLVAAPLVAGATTPAEAPTRPAQDGASKGPALPTTPPSRPLQPPRSSFATSAAEAETTPPLQPDRPVQVNLTRGQSAFFRVAPEAGGAWSVVTRRLGGDTDTLLAALDDKGGVVIEDDDGAGDGLASRIAVQPDDGARLVRAGTLEDAGGRFELVLTREAVLPPPDYATDRAAAGSRPPLALGTPVPVRLRAGRQAFFRLPDDRQNMIARTRALSAGADTVLALLDAEGNVVLENDDGGEGFASVLPLDAPGPLTLRASLVEGSTGSFEVMMERETPLPPPDYPTDLEAARARGPLTPGQTVHIVLGRNSQAVFALPESGLRTVRTTNLADDVDTNLALLDAKGEVIRENDDGDDGLASRVVIAGPGNPAAFVRATLLNGRRGAFDLVAEEGAPVQTTGASASVEEAATRPTLLLGEVVRVQVGAGTPAVIALPHDGRPALAMTFALGEGVDTVIEMIDAEGTVLAENDDAEGLASRLDIPSGPRPAFLRIRVLNDQEGAFSLVLVRPAP